jgi:predicted dehydrogenase
MLQRIMGCGAKSVEAVENDDTVRISVDYAGGQSAVVDLIHDNWVYGGILLGGGRDAAFEVNFTPLCSAELRKVADFFNGTPSPVELEDTLEVMAMLDAAEKSVQTGLRITL